MTDLIERLRLGDGTSPDHLLLLEAADALGMTKEALKLALEALMEHEGNCELGKEGVDRHVKAIAAIKDALAQPEQEPVAWSMFKRGRLESFWMDKGDAYDYEFTSEHEWKPLYTTPPQRQWVGLTDEERQDIALEVPMDAVCITETKLKEKNT
jgi:hypothetical protein